MPLVGCNNSDTDYQDETFRFIAPDQVINPNSEYLIVIGDIQEYTETFENLEYLTYSIDWIRNQNNFFHNIKAVLQDGDVTNGDQPWQWAMAIDAFHHLKDSTMYVWSTGNHDYQWDGPNGTEITDRSTTLLNSYAPNPQLDKSIVASFKKGKYDNIILESGLSGRNIQIISLEFGPRPDAVEWARRYVSSHPDKKFILMTHEFMTAAGNRVANGKSFAAMQFPTIPHTEPEYIWENLIKPNDNVICLVNGHNGFCKYLETPNDTGRQVPQILFNLQYQENGGDSMLQLWEFPKGENRINITVYNTLRQEYHLPEETTFSFTY